MEKQIAKQTVAALIKKESKLSTKYPSSSKYTRDTGVVVEACSPDGEQNFRQVPTRIKGKRGYYATTKKVLIEEVVRISFNQTGYSLGVNGVQKSDEEFWMAKAVEALTAKGYVVTAKRFVVEGFAKDGFVISKAAN